jgi:regulator of protease activity HflC (stomatin/prohibitin superfamily)
VARAEAMNWVDAILSRLRELWPFVRIPPWGKGVRYRYDWRRSALTIQLLDPGIHLQIWWLDDTNIMSVVEQVYDLPSQPVTTKDDIAITFSVNFCFRVVDPIAAVVEVHDFTHSLQGLAMTHCAQKIRDWTWKELLEGQKDLERSLKGTMTTRAKRWGVEVTDVGITVLVRARPIAWLKVD